MNDRLFIEYLKARREVESRIARTIDLERWDVKDRHVKDMLSDIYRLITTLANVDEQMINHIKANEANEANAE